ncbi:MAG: transcriptional repressor [Actinomycetota bacterium]|nr:transcriptional repressor [Actinomycetota bacterium]MDK1017510.1 transcriptional repressor [Actinomycetota bacterium]MDK1027367.1 transcriptional repressor [Actinomycetota bacterium]MDK1037379.1 transcriptional repressor [Actinomycetota bacterium]MDK1097242.1 transcriptional repressor [Actinomycetota bacterium]
MTIDDFAASPQSTQTPMDLKQQGEEVSWEIRLRDSGLRATRPRVLVLETLRRAGGHRSAEEVRVFLEQSNTPLTRGTVYKILGDLVAVDLVMWADRGPGAALYEIADEWHHHFVCRSCDAVIDIPCYVGSKPCLETELAGADIDEAQVIIRGRCPACVARDSG